MSRLWPPCYSNIPSLIKRLLRVTHPPPPKTLSITPSQTPFTLTLKFPTVIKGNLLLPNHKELWVVQYGESVSREIFSFQIIKSCGLYSMEKVYQGKSSPFKS